MITGGADDADDEGGCAGLGGIGEEIAAAKIMMHDDADDHDDDYLLW